MKRCSSARSPGSAFGSGRSWSTRLSAARTSAAFCPSIVLVTALLSLGGERVISPQQRGKRFPPVVRAAPRNVFVCGVGETLESFPRFGDDVGCRRQWIGERRQTHRTLCEPR